MPCFRHIFVDPFSFDGLFKENKIYLSDLQYPIVDGHGLSENPSNMNPPVLRITVMVSPLWSHFPLVVSTTIKCFLFF